MPIQDYFRMKNVFGPQNDVSASSPSYSNPRKNQNFFEDEEVMKSPVKAVQMMEEEPEDEMSALDQFRQEVLNPPQHRNPGILRALGTGLLSGLQGTGEGQRKPVYNEKGKVIGSKEKGFWETFGDKAFNVEEAGDILNIPNEGRLADWKIRTGGLKDAATIEKTAESNAALAEYRRAQAGAVPVKLDQAGEKIAQTGERNAVLADQGQQRINILRDKEAKNTLTDKERIELQGRIRDQQIAQQGQNQLANTAAVGGNQQANIAAQGTNQLNLEDARSQNDLTEIDARGDQSRQTKQVVPGKNTATTDLKPESATQSKVRLQLRANEYLQANPQHADFININDDTGMVDITPPSTNWRGAASGPDKATYDAIVNHMKGTDKASTPSEKKTNDKAPVVVPPANKKPAGSVVEDTNSGAPKKIVQRNKKTGKIRTSLDGGKTWTIS